MAKWAEQKGQTVCPTSTETLVRYLACRDKRECGPSVPDAVRATVLWMHKRLEVAPPDTKADLLLAIRDKAVQERGKETKAVPILVWIVGRVEQFLTSSSEAEMKRPLQMFVWWVLCMIYASLRFDDACHVRPDTLAISAEALSPGRPGRRRQKGKGRVYALWWPTKPRSATAGYSRLDSFPTEPDV